MKRRMLLVLALALVVAFPVHAAMTSEAAQVSISIPNNGQNLAGTVPVDVTASGQANRVEFFLDNVLRSTDTVKPYQWQWDTTTATDGSHIVRAEAVYKTRRAKAQLAVTVNNVAPPPALCADGIDNDGDGLIDFPSDPGCSSAADTDETDLPPPPPPSGLWNADMEEGTLADWSNGGGEYNSGGGDSVASQTVVHTGSWSAKSTINTSGGSSGTRLFHWTSYRGLAAGQSATTSVWVYIPAPVTIGGYFNLFQFKSKTQDSSYIDVFFQLNLFNSGSGFILKAAWGCGYENPAFPVGPYSTSTRADTCNWFAPLAQPVIPVGQWVQVSSQITPSSGYSGRMKFWLNGTLLYDFVNVKTGYPNTNSVNGVDTQWAVNAYANGLTPSTYSHYVDDAEVSTP